MYDPLILRGNLKVAGADVSAQVTSFKISGTRSVIDIPARFGARASVAAGNDTYSITIDFLQDMDATALSSIFYEALASTTGEIAVAGSFESGVVGPSNPLFSGVAIVTQVGLGGAYNTVGTDSVTYPLKDRPSKSIS